MSDFPECDKYEGRQRAVCRGEAGLPESGDHSTNAYRRLWGLLPLGVHDYSKPLTEKQQSRANSDPKLGRHAGTNLAILLKACGIHVKDGCTCEEWINRMNAWTIEENYAHRQEVIDHLKDRAKQEKMSVKKKFWTGVLIMWNGMLPMVSELVDEAIWQAKHHQK